MAQRVVLAMSGGVDSSAAAVLLKEQGYDVIGLFMRSGESQQACAADGGGRLPVVQAPTHRQGCCSAEDAADARRVADRLGIPFHSLNFRDAFRKIKDYFVAEYLSGRTPNPCVQCNNWLKFGRLWEFAKQVGADSIATGHYARIDCEAEDGPALLRGVDGNKDQSYVLFGIRHELLKHVLLPLGGYHKPDIRALAAESGLRVADKKDSYEICFVPDNDYAGFLRRYGNTTDTAGDFVNVDGEILGQHPGYERFTIGQRKGLGITFGEPRFVVRIEAQTRRVVLGTQDDLARMELQVKDVNWLTAEPPENAEVHCSVKIRYRSPDAACTFRRSGDAAMIKVAEPLYGVAPGQAGVFYDGDRVLGGGWIREPGFATSAEESEIQHQI